ncbi:MAG: hypothetical protein K940chlam2_00362 [Chlamydiae bacterium]|nr:hypothetical protein [Chlamydiota bacterium]
MKIHAIDPLSSSLPFSPVSPKGFHPQPDSIIAESSKDSCVKYLFSPFLWLYNWITSLFCAPTEADPIFKEKIPKNMDIRGTKSLDQSHMSSYLRFLQRSEFPNFCFRPQIAYMDKHLFENFFSHKTALDHYMKHGLPRKQLFFYPINNYDNHWRVIHINPTLKTIEYFDSLATWRPQEEIQKLLDRINDKLGGGYQTKFTISEPLQQDVHNCGIWALYFILKCLRGEKIEYANMDAFRLEVQQALIDHPNFLVDLRGEDFNLWGLKYTKFSIDHPLADDNIYRFLLYLNVSKFTNFYTPPTINFPTPATLVSTLDQTAILKQLEQKVLCIFPMKDSANHWTCMVIDPKERILFDYNSKGIPLDDQILSQIQQHLKLDDYTINRPVTASIQSTPVQGGVCMLFFLWQSFPPNDLPKNLEYFKDDMEFELQNSLMTLNKHLAKTYSQFQSRKQWDQWVKEKIQSDPFQFELDLFNGPITFKP